MVADLWEPEEQQYAIAFVVLSSVGGTSVSQDAYTVHEKAHADNTCLLGWPDRWRTHRQVPDLALELLDTVNLRCSSPSCSLLYARKSLDYPHGP